MEIIGKIHEINKLNNNLLKLIIRNNGALLECIIDLNKNKNFNIIFIKIFIFI
jgi:hypothetical protein